MTPTTHPRVAHDVVPRTVVKGGSHLCADCSCRRYRPAARRPQVVDTGMGHIGFRCAWPAATPEEER